MKRPDPPAEYAGKSNPLDGDPTAADAGKETYTKNCISCHGESGRGDGAAAASLDPPPGNLARDQKEMSDAYMLWRISEGGMMDPFNSVMPAWKAVYSEDEIWQVVTYLRTYTE